VYLPPPATRRPGNPFRVLVSLLYARFTWVTRHEDGALSAPAARYAKALGLRTHRLRECLARLREQDYLDRLQWHGEFFYARPRCPERLARTAGAGTAGTGDAPAFAHAVDTAPITYEAAVDQLLAENAALMEDFERHGD
jgi:hypothetical protein